MKSRRSAIPFRSFDFAQDRLVAINCHSYTNPRLESRSYRRLIFTPHPSPPPQVVGEGWEGVGIRVRLPVYVGAAFLRPFDKAQGSGQAWREYGIFSKREYVRSLTFVRDDRRVCHFDQREKSFFY